MRPGDEIWWYVGDSVVKAMGAATKKIRGIPKISMLEKPLAASTVVTGPLYNAGPPKSVTPRITKKVVATQCSLS